MRRHLVFATVMALIWHAGAAAAESIPVIEQSIYRPEPPFENLKRALYVRAQERPLLPLISAASTSIAQFFVEVNVSGYKPEAIMPHVLPDARARLRLPPLVSTGRPERFVDTIAYCWKSDNQDQLRFLIEWADITTKARYTDSYVFVRRGAIWYVEKNDSIAPWHWVQTARYFQRDCPPDA